MANIDCTNIELEQIRARIVINGTFTIETPYVRTFNINKTRSSNVSTFSASIEIPANGVLVNPNGTTSNFGSPQGTAGVIQIYAGTKATYISKGPIFTGLVRRMNPTPIVGKPNYFLVSLSGNDVFSKLENKRFSRRIATDGPGLFVTINGGSGTRPSTQTWSIDKKIGAGSHTYGNLLPDMGKDKKHNDVTKYNANNTTSHGWLFGLADPAITEPVGPSGDGLDVHDHANMSRGGPAFGVYKK